MWFIWTVLLLLLLLPLYGVLCMATAFFVLRPFMWFVRLWERHGSLVIWNRFVYGTVAVAYSSLFYLVVIR